MSWWDSIVSVFTGGVDRLGSWNLTQRLFWYSVLASFFLVLYFIALPRFDCKLGYQSACAYVDGRYAKGKTP